MKQISLLILIAFCTHFSLQAQNSCSDQLRTAQRSFDDGLLDDIPTILSGCMKNGFTKEEKINAYKLLIQTYLFSDQLHQADEIMMQFLYEYPDYSITANDPKEFINLHSTYRTTPIFKMEFLAGLSIGVPMLIEDFGVSGSTGEYYLGAGFTTEVNYLNIFKGDFSYSAGLSFTYVALGYWNPIFDYSEVEATLWNMSVGVPLSARYNHNFSGVNFFAKAGFEPAYLIRSTSDYTRIINIIGKEPYPGVENLTPLNRKMDIRPFLGAGVTINIGRDQLTVSLNYKFSTFIQIDDDLRYSDLNIINKYHVIPDDLLLNQAIVSLSYIRPIYNPKKIR